MKRNQKPTVDSGSDPGSDSGAGDLATAVLTASRVLVGLSARSLAGVEENLTLTQFRTLVVLHSQGSSPLHALADELAVNASTALRMVDRLLASDLVTRSSNPADRREVVLALTDRGRDIVDRVTSQRRTEIATIVERMPSTHQAWLVVALQSFAEAADEPVALVERW